MKTNYKKLLILLLFFCASFHLHAQKTIAVTGGNATGGGGTASYTIGQIDYSSATGTNGLSNQGVQHPHEIYVVGLDPNPSNDIQLSVYPNPAASYVTLKVQNLVFNTLSYQLYDASGLLLDSDLVKGATSEISVEKYASSTLILKVLDKNKVIRTFKIIKK